MSEQARREMWRSRCEQLVSSGMRVHEWCDLNHVKSSSMYGWLRTFHEEDPSVFDYVGLPEGMDGYGRGWFEAVRREYAATHAIVPQPRAQASFAVVDTASLAGAAAAPAPAAPAAGAGAPEITVTIGAATVGCPAGCDERTLAAVLRAVSSL